MKAAAFQATTCCSMSTTTTRASLKTAMALAKWPNTMALVAAICFTVSTIKPGISTLRMPLISTQTVFGCITPQQRRWAALGLMGTGIRSTDRSSYGMNPAAVALSSQSAAAPLGRSAAVPAALGSPSAVAPPAPAPPAPAPSSASAAAAAARCAVGNM